MCIGLSATYTYLLPVLQSVCHHQGVERYKLWVGRWWFGRFGVLGQSCNSHSHTFVVVAHASNGDQGLQTTRWPLLQYQLAPPTPACLPYCRVPPCITWPPAFSCLLPGYMPPSRQARVHTASSLLIPAVEMAICLLLWTARWATGHLLNEAADVLPASEVRCFVAGAVYVAKWTDWGDVN